MRYSMKLVRCVFITAILSSVPAGLAASAGTSRIDVDQTRPQPTLQEFTNFQQRATAKHTEKSAQDCRPDVRCDVCTRDGVHTCRVINCRGEVTSTFTENCIPPDGSQCEAWENCSDCVNHSRTCRLIDCNGHIQSTYTEDCNGGDICTPTTTHCDALCSPSGVRTCQVLDCNNIPVSTYDQPCTPPKPSYSCSSCAGTTCSRGPGNNPGSLECYNVSQTVNGVGTQVERVCTECADISTTLYECRNQRDADFRCGQ